MGAWEPTARQEAYLRSGAREALLAGGSGCGATEAIVVHPMRWTVHPDFRGILFVQRNQIGATVDRTHRFYGAIGGTITRGIWTFPSSSTIEIADQCTDPDRITGSYQWMGFDGAEHVEDSALFLRLITWLRSTATALPERLRLTATPDGPGRHWLLSRYASWLTGGIADGARVDGRTAYRSTIEDNPHADAGHDDRMRLLGDVSYARLRHGDWEIDPEVSQDTVPDNVLDFMTWSNPGWVRPNHLHQMATDIEAAFRGGDIERYYTIPPRHGKSELVMNGLAWGLRNFPETPILYATHTARFANKQSKRIKRLARNAGVTIEHGSDRIDEWETPEGGGLIARGVGGEVVGRGFKIIVIDDPFKSRQLSEVPTYRERVFQWIRDDVFTRGTPDASVFVVHTRYTPDDPIGRLIKEGWQGTVLRALAEDDDPLGRAPGEPLAPELGWTLEKLAHRRKNVNEYGWASLFQCRPQPRGGQVFDPPQFYTDLPKTLKRAYGVDLAYTAKSRADRSVMVEMLRHDPNPVGAHDSPDPIYYIPYAIVAQVESPEFARMLKARQVMKPAQMLFLCSGVEKGAAQFMAREVPRFIMQVVQFDKFVRAQDMSAAWNNGRVLLPDPSVYSVPWLSDFLDVFDGFTGKNDTHDDEVDAAVAAFQLLHSPDTGPLSGYL